MGIVSAQVPTSTHNCGLVLSNILTVWLCSLQLAIGIIAHCASTLKPLVGGILKLTSSVSRSKPYERHEYNNLAREQHNLPLETIGSRRLSRGLAANKITPLSDIDASTDELTLRPDQHTHRSEITAFTLHGTSSLARGTRDEWSGGVDSPTKGILRTREVIVE